MSIQEPITNAILEFKLIKVFDKLTKESSSKHSAVADHKQTQTGTRSKWYSGKIYVGKVKTFTSVRCI